MLSYNIFRGGKMKALNIKEKCQKYKMEKGSLRLKFSFNTLVIAIIPIIIFAVTTLFLYQIINERRSYKHIEQNISIMNSRLDMAFSNGELCVNYLVLGLNDIETNKNKSNLQYETKIQSLLTQTGAIFEGTSSIVYIDKDGKYFSTSRVLYLRDDEVLNSDYVKQLKEGSHELKFFSEQSNLLASTEDESVITLGKRVARINDGKTLGYLLVNIDNSYLAEFMENQISEYMLFNNNGELIIGSETAHSLNSKIIDVITYDGAVFDIDNDEGSFLLAGLNLESNDWKIVGITNLNEFQLSFKEMFYIFFFTGIAIFILLILEIYLVGNKITQPILELSRRAEEIAKGNLDVVFDIHSEDEIGTLNDVLGKMTIEIKQLISEMKKVAKKKREYELALIHEQIKPHFLYNTLDIIIMLYDMGKFKEARKTTKKLADYYRKSLSNSKEILCLSEEIAMNIDYLDLQQIRYRDLFSYQIDVDLDVMNYKIPRMTLQPLIENALYHGLKEKGSGVIRISGSKRDDKVVISVEDDGVGMSSEKIAELQGLMGEPIDHFGIFSSNHRLKLYFGFDSCLKIESQKNVGTKIIMELPIEKEAKKDD